MRLDLTTVAKLFLLTTINDVFLGNPCSKIQDIKKDSEKNLLQQQVLRVKLNQLLSEEGKKRCYAMEVTKVH